MNDLETPPVAPVPPTRVHFILNGPHGVRPGWRLLVFLALLAVLFGLAAPVQRMVEPHLEEGFTAFTTILGEAFAFALVLIATAVMGKFEHRSLGDYGLPVRQMFRRDFWAGALWGFVMLTVVVGLMAAVHAYSMGGLALSGGAILKYGFLWAVGFLMVGFFEEFAFRGYMQFTLTMGLGFWPAALVTCILFALAHRGNPGENWVGLVEIVLIALFLCTALRRTGSLWFAIGWHMAFDWGESFFYSTPDSGVHAVGHLFNASLMGSKWLSGGTVGPEASVFDLVVTVAGILLLIKMYPEAKYPPMASLAAGPAPADLPPVVPQPELSNQDGSEGSVTS